MSVPLIMRSFKSHVHTKSWASNNNSKMSFSPIRNLFHVSVVRHFSRPVSFPTMTLTNQQRRCVTIKSLDHLVITCNDIDKTIEFYEKLGMRSIEFGQGRKALSFGNQKINLHQKGKEFEPKAKLPQPGSQDLCFVLDDAETSIESAMKSFQENDVQIVEGPVNRTGAVGPILSIYVRDPDGNLIELSSYSNGKQ